jgi:hypothetical protein
MTDELDFDLSPDQWEALRALRNPPPNGRPSRAHLVKGLIELGFVAVEDGRPVMTPEGRKMLVRGSCRLLDVAA